MESLNSLFTKFKKTYTPEWFNRQYAKFSAHPANTQCKDEYDILIKSENEYSADAPFRKINFFDFVYNIEISSFYGEQANEYNLHTVTDTSSEVVQTIKPNSSYQDFKPETQLIEWEKDFFNHVSMLVSKITSIEESVRFIKYLENLIKEEFKDLSLRPALFKEVIEAFQDRLQAQLKNINTDYQEILNAITSTDKKICFTGTPTDLARIVAQLYEYIPTDNKSELSEIIVEHFTLDKKPLKQNLFARQLRDAITEFNKQSTK